MKSRILHSSYVINFLDEGFNSDGISSILKSETDKILKSVDEVILKDWEIQFRGIYGKGSVLKVYKKMPSNLNDKLKLITVHIPIPKTYIVKWGVDDTHFISVGKPPNEDKNMYLLDVNFQQFTNRTDYILDCMRRAIKFCFQDGITVKSVKIKISKL